MIVQLAIIGTAVLVVGTALLILCRVWMEHHDIPWDGR